jgi:hypothetical protein
MARRFPLFHMKIGVNVQRILMNPTGLLRFKQRRPRRNLPAPLSRKHGESNFVSSFSKAYVASVESAGVGGKEFALIFS